MDKELEGAHVGVCEECNGIQTMTPSGAVCRNGHGGVPTIRPCWACIHSSRGACQQGHDPAVDNEHDECGDWEADALLGSLGPCTLSCERCNKRDATKKAGVMNLDTMQAEDHYFCDGCYDMMAPVSTLHDSGSTESLIEAQSPGTEGATGEFPDGKITEDDEGELEFSVGPLANGLVGVKFGKPVAWMALPPDTAIELATMLVESAGKANAILSEMKPTIIKPGE
jgi:hypothetical protein